MQMKKLLVLLAAGSLILTAGACSKESSSNGPIAPEQTPAEEDVRQEPKEAVLTKEERSAMLDPSRWDSVPAGEWLIRDMGTVPENQKAWVNSLFESEWQESEWECLSYMSERRLPDSNTVDYCFLIRKAYEPDGALGYGTVVIRTGWDGENEAPRDIYAMPLFIVPDDMDPFEWEQSEDVFAPGRCTADGYELYARLAQGKYNEDDKILLCLNASSDVPVPEAYKLLIEKDGEASLYDVVLQD